MSGRVGLPRALRTGPHARCLTDYTQTLQTDLVSYLRAVVSSRPPSPDESAPEVCVRTSIWPNVRQATWSRDGARTSGAVPGTETTAEPTTLVVGESQTTCTKAAAGGYDLLRSSTRGLAVPEGPTGQLTPLVLAGAPRGPSRAERTAWLAKSSRPTRGTLRHALRARGTRSGAVSTAPGRDFREGAVYSGGRR